ncbi:MAG: sulfur-oxidizing protein SoxX [Gammaproteobacteria bacterium]|jgi:sulfur-oxidizing protein SoxX
MIKLLNGDRIILTATTAFLFIATLSACDMGAKPVKGFVLPEGDIINGREIFASVGCRSCHTIEGEDFPPFEPDDELNIELGGTVYRVKNYGDLLTSILSPNHIVSAKYRATLDRADRKNAQSPMPSFNGVLNVTQLIDLTAYLHSRYELQPRYNGYYH